ncbi:pyridoxal phosphate-dependent aminotransferase [Treponema sp.]|uniref:pyridoxal phosphate-dependent aminotransferase n=1 Tax=Treponema sp. TaxID=166 RepID=UPI0025F6A36D|nr:pyridoxal phosphate-dependent aminotransferase [Treponema sp.]MCR5218350.1 pyridoxal phosphate-dependent aminotransferase [Treponema sp.]
MAISAYIKETMSNKSAGVIRKMFEEGLKLKAQYGEDKVFDFSLGNPDLDPPAKVIETIKKCAEDTSRNIHGYMPNAGYPECRAAMARKTSMEQGVDIPGDCVVMAVGAAGALNSLFKAILNPGDNVIVPAPFFTEYRHYVKNYGGSLIEVPAAEDFSIDVEAISRSLNEKTAAVLINLPNNPTGRVYSEENIKALCAVLEEHGKKCGRKPYLILDEPYRAIVYDNVKVPAAFPLYDSSVVVTSFAKNLSLPGERLGYVCVNPACPDKADLIAAVIFCTRVLGFVNAPALFQRVVAQSYDAPCDYSLYKKRRDELMEILDEAGIQHLVPEGAFYMWCKAPDYFKGDDMAFCDYLKKYMILGAPGSSFGGPGWLRLAYCVSEKTILNSKDAFVQAMKDLKK